MNWIIRIATVLVIVGGINWGLVGAFEFNLVEAIFGDMTAASRTIYVLVGLSALVAIANLFMLRDDTGQRSQTTTRPAGDGPRGNTVA